MLSEDKMNQIAHHVQEAMLADPRVEVHVAPTQLLRAIKRVIAAGGQIEAQCDGKVRRTLASYTRKIVEGSPEWDVLYKKLLKAEIEKHSRIP